MQKVECISVRTIGTSIVVGNHYYIDQMSIGGMYDGDWYVDVYADAQKEHWIGRFKLSRFKTCV